MSSSSGTEQWLRFFVGAGVPHPDCARYAMIFMKNRMQMNMLVDLSKDYLRDMGITAIGDIIAILRHAKHISAQNFLCRTPPPSRGFDAPPPPRPVRNFSPPSSTNSTGKLSISLPLPTRASYTADFQRSSPLSSKLHVQQTELMKRLQKLAKQPEKEMNLRDPSPPNNTHQKACYKQTNNNSSSESRAEVSSSPPPSRRKSHDSKKQYLLLQFDKDGSKSERFIDADHPAFKRMKRHYPNSSLGSPQRATECIDRRNNTFKMPCESHRRLGVGERKYSSDGQTYTKNGRQYVVIGRTYTEHERSHTPNERKSTEERHAYTRNRRSSTNKSDHSERERKLSESSRMESAYGTTANESLRKRPHKRITFTPERFQ